MLRTALARFSVAAFWFFLLPAAAAYALLTWLNARELGSPLLEFAREQSVPAGIALFAIFETILYSLRHRLPFAYLVLGSGRAGMPLEVRKEYEVAARVLGEAEQILKKRGRAIQAALSTAEHAALLASLESVRAAMQADPVDVRLLSERVRLARDVLDVRLAPWRKGELREYGESIGIAVLVAFLLRAVVVEAFKIPSGSMLPTLQIGDHIFVNKFVYGPKVPFSRTRVLESMPPHRGEVIVFSHPVPSLSEDDLIKRVIAVPGDILEVDSGHPIINGWRVPSCSVGPYTVRETEEFDSRPGDLFVEYLGPTAYLAFYEKGHFPKRQGPYEVQPGEVWVMGDNRHNSSDSRAWPNPKGGQGRGVPYENIKGRAMIVWAPLSRMFVTLMGQPTLLGSDSKELHANIDHCLSDRPAPDQTQPPSGKAALQARIHAGT
jgi:signal peptidase I